MHSHPHVHTVVRSTTRMEIYSDAVMAIVITLLVLELHPPELSADAGFGAVFTGLMTILPNLGAFAFSFLTISVFWVNHHHFFHEVDRIDSALMWYNNALLFFLSLIPFTTAFLAHHPMVPGVVMLYCFVLFCAALMFALMSHHALFDANLLDHDVGRHERLASQRRTWIGVVLYGIATLSALGPLWISAILMLAIPAYFITPRLLHDHDGHA